MAKNNFGKVVDCIAFVGLVLVAIVLVLQKIFSGDGSFISALRTVGESIAYTITAISAFFFVRTKRNVWWYIAYTAALILVVVFVIIR